MKGADDVKNVNALQDELASCRFARLSPVYDSGGGLRAHRRAEARSKRLAKGGSPT